MTLLRPTSLDPAWEMDSRADLPQQLQSSAQVASMLTVRWSLLPCPSEGFHLKVFSFFLPSAEFRDPGCYITLLKHSLFSSLWGKLPIPFFSLKERMDSWNLEEQMSVSNNKKNQPNKQRIHCFPCPLLSSLLSFISLSPKWEMLICCRIQEQFCVFPTCPRADGCLDCAINASVATPRTAAPGLQTSLWENGKKILPWQPIFFFQTGEKTH